MVSYIKSNKMKHGNIQKELIFYIDNELSVEKRLAVDKHLEECADCRSFLAFLQEEMKVIEMEKRLTATPSFYTRLSARLDEETKPQVKSKWVRLLQPAFFSLLLIIGIYGGFKLGSNASSQKSNQPSIIYIEMFNDFEAEPIESFLLDEL
jgi:hypothetical protein